MFASWTVSFFLLTHINLQYNLLYCFWIIFILILRHVDAAIQQKKTATAASNKKRDICEEECKVD